MIFCLTFFITCKDTNRISSNGWFSVMIQPKLKSSLPSKKTACIANASDDTFALDMDTVARAHEEREACFLKTILTKLKEINESCVPTFYQNYPLFTKNNTEWCTETKDITVNYICAEVYDKYCPSPCSSISFSHSMEPFHGAPGGNKHMCGEQANVIQLSMNENIEMMKG